MALSGQKTVTTAGTEVVLGTQQIGAALMVKALTTNTNLVYVGESSGGVSSSTGMPLAAGDTIIFDFVGQLNPDSTSLNQLKKSIFIKAPLLMYKWAI
jgi:hypothetical protein